MSRSESPAQASSSARACWRVSQSVERVERDHPVTLHPREEMPQRREPAVATRRRQPHLARAPPRPLPRPAVEIRRDVALADRHQARQDGTLQDLNKHGVGA
jgi:hypothetical protein